MQGGLTSRGIAWIMAARPKTLTAAIVPIWGGTALAYAIHEKVQISLSLFAFLSAVFIQIGTNLFNDAIDFDKGTDTHERLGPQRVTQSGLMTSRQVRWGGVVCFVVASLLALPLIYVGGKSILVIGVLSLIAGYAYTGGPWPLAYLGLGELFVLIFFGGAAVGGMYYLHTGLLDSYAMVASLQVGCLAMVLIAINNLRDSKTDLKANKKTLAVRFGEVAAKIMISCFIVMPFVLGYFWKKEGLGLAFTLPLFVTPLAAMIIRQIWMTSPSQVYNKFLAQSALLQLSFGALLSVGLWIKS